MARPIKVVSDLDWLSIVLYMLLVAIGLTNIYAAEYDEGVVSLFDFSTSHGRQVLWIGVSMVVAVVAVIIDARFYITFANWIYWVLIAALILTFLFGKTVKGATSWIDLFGVFTIQTSEFAKSATLLAVAKYLDGYNRDFKLLRDKIRVFSIIALPIGLVVLQNDFGTALVFFSLLLMLYREGLPTSFLVIPVVLASLFISALMFDKFWVFVSIGLIGSSIAYLARENRKLLVTTIAGMALAGGLVLGVNYVYENVLKPHHQSRINVWLGKELDTKGAGYNVHQSLIAIGSGGLTGKGFLNGTQTKFNFVPEQSTDFIFCTVGEEHGFLGSLLLVAAYMGLLLRLVVLAERQKSRFARVYGYGVASILFFHFLLNISMTLGLFPVIGIPLPFLSYGGSSLMGFTLLLFVFLKLDADLRYYFD